jgi:dihydroorotate dehydrogenase
MYSLIRPLLFRLDPETAHGLTLRLLRVVEAFPPLQTGLRSLFTAPQKPVQLFGLKISNPVGLAAGYDKDGLGWQGLAWLGFGHIEIGTVTLRPQPGNPRPRIFRLPEDGAIINRMGFPGRGADFVARRLTGKRPEGLILGVNIGKNKDTPLEEAAQDYISLLRCFAPLADYLAINVSSPNTTGLRRLQARDMLESLLGELADERRKQSQYLGKVVPLLVKLAPDLTDHELDDALEALRANGMDGVIATNTTLARDGLRSLNSSEIGGLSGIPLHLRSLEIVRKIYERTGGQLPIIGVGGIHDAASAKAMLDAGASLVQIYTGLIYAGPGLVKQILNSIQ